MTDEELIKHLSDENDRLRGLLASGRGPCAYCDLPAERINECGYGFPGCPRADDIQLRIETQLEQKLTGLFRGGGVSRTPAS